MADSTHAAAPAINTPIEGHKFDEKERPLDAPPANKPKVEEEEEEDEDIDALIEDLESQDGHVDEEEEGMSLSSPSQQSCQQTLPLPGRANSFYHDIPLTNCLQMRLLVSAASSPRTSSRRIPVWV